MRHRDERHDHDHDHGVIVTETEDYISFRLPSWLTVEERARIKAALDEWWATVLVRAAELVEAEEGEPKA